MSIKIIGGVARGFTLATPSTFETRPTSIMLRRKLFDWRQSMEGYSFIDLFAGSGSVGFEALSRGADTVFLNDSARISFQSLRQNRDKIIASHRFDPERIQLSQADALKWIDRDLSFALPETESCILYFDPPYEKHALYTEALALLKEKGFRGEVWVESDRLKGPSKQALTGLFHSVNKIVDHGDHFVLVGILS